MICLKPKFQSITTCVDIAVFVKIEYWIEQRDSSRDSEVQYLFTTQEPIQEFRIRAKMGCSKNLETRNEQKKTKCPLILNLPHLGIFWKKWIDEIHNIGQFLDFDFRVVTLETDMIKTWLIHTVNLGLFCLINIWLSHWFIFNFN